QRAGSPLGALDTAEISASRPECRGRHERTPGADDAPAPVGPRHSVQSECTARPEADTAAAGRAVCTGAHRLAPDPQGVHTPDPGGSSRAADDTAHGFPWLDATGLGRLRTTQSDHQHYR